MAKDRDERLGRAERAVRQGRLDAAIAEYDTLVSEQPGDLSSANALGDLLVRAGRSPEALPLYMRVADAFLREGFFSKAAGFYRKVLKFAPGDEVPAERLAEALAAQGLVVEARGVYASLLEARRRRGDAEGAGRVLARLAEADTREPAPRLRWMDNQVSPELAPETEGPPGAEGAPAAVPHADAREVRVAGPSGPPPAQDADVEDEAPPSSRPSEVDLTLAVNALSSELAECATAEDDVPGAGRSARVVRGHGYAGHGAPGEEPPGADEGAARPLEEVFEGMRAQASSTHDVDGRQQLALGTTYLAAGLIDQAVAAYARAAHDPTARLEACSALGEIFEDARDYGPAIEWLERAVDAPDATEEARLSVMRRLAAVLEAADEPARALAVWLEILTSHPDDAEAAARVSQSPPPGAGR